MAHERYRYQEAPLDRLLKASPVVGIFGHRQVGKTTLIQKVEGRQYCTLDLERTLSQVDADPMTFVAQALARPLTIDESQFSPTLFPAIKEWVRTHKKPGQFLLSGSVRFLARRAIRESLTGRILLTELLPMNRTELNGQEPNFSVLHWLKESHWETFIERSAAKAAPLIQKGQRQFQEYLVHGGLPGIAFMRDERLRGIAFSSLVDTLLERDLRMIVATTVTRSSLLGLLVELARGQGRPISISELVRRTRISAVTVRRLLQAFEALYVLRFLRSEGTARAPVYFFEDQGEATALLGDARESGVMNLTRGLFANLRPMLQRAVVQRLVGAYEMVCFRTQYGSEVPLVLKCGQRVLGFIPLPGEEVTRGALGSAQSLKNHYEKAKVLFVHSGRRVEILGKDLASVPIGLLV